MVGAIGCNLMDSGPRTVVAREGIAQGRSLATVA